MLGSHIAEKLRAQGRQVRALVRPNSDVEFLKSIGVELSVGDLTDPASCERAMEGVSVVYHCAAKVGDWGTWEQFQGASVAGTLNLGKAAILAQVGRFVHISSTSAYGHPREGGPPLDETTGLDQNPWMLWDDYTRSKFHAERVVWGLYFARVFPLVVIRPSWLYGERDRTTLGRLIGRLRAGQVPMIGRGDNPLSAVYAGNVADAAILAAHHPAAVGEGFNVTHQGQLTQAEFLGMFAEALGAPPIRRKISYNLTFAAATLIEGLARARGRTTPPLITRYATWLMGRNLSYLTTKAETKLGWKPAVGNRESIERTVRWFLEDEARKRREPTSPGRK